jgi:hypothetical protein
MLEDTVRTLPTAIALLASVLLCCGCGGSKPLSAKDQSTRVEQRGYSILPPPGAGWYLAARSPEVVTFTKDTGTPARTFRAIAEIRPADAPYDSPSNYLAARQREVEQMDSNRYRVTEQAVALDDRLGRFCIRYQIRAEDRGPESEGTPDQQAEAFARWLIERPPILEIHGYRCLHPNAPEYEVEVSYSQRAKAEQLDPSLAGEGNAFATSMEFRPLQ